MTRTKLKRLSKVKELPNVFSLETAERQNTIQEYFKSKNIFTLEIGCGHGDYSVELAQKYPQRNFVGLDIKGARVFQGAMKAIHQKLGNVAFIIGKAEKLNEIFPAKSIEEIYIAFPDPHIRRTNQNRRLISPNFLKIYKDLLIASGIIHFKTDNQSLYEYTLRIISSAATATAFTLNLLLTAGLKTTQAIKISVTDCTSCFQTEIIMKTMSSAKTARVLLLCTPKM